MRGEKQQLTLLTNRISNTSFNTEKGDFAPIPGNDQWKVLSLLFYNQPAWAAPPFTFPFLQLTVCFVLFWMKLKKFYKLFGLKLQTTWNPCYNLGLFFFPKLSQNSSQIGKHDQSFRLVRVKQKYPQNLKTKSLLPYFGDFCGEH